MMRVLVITTTLEEVTIIATIVIKMAQSQTAKMNLDNPFFPHIVAMVIAVATATATAIPTSLQIINGEEDQGSQ